MNFGEALEAIKSGKKAKRKGWNKRTIRCFGIHAGMYHSVWCGN